jgi:hypothetical protein
VKLIDTETHASNVSRVISVKSVTSTAGSVTFVKEATRDQTVIYVGPVVLFLWLNISL